ncbi:ankyrin repeat domain-containing protein [Streptomyces sp. NBC_01443]|uniref:ankyrin repeat domain-containing protein n=1 Tax=Streptomyces sp. NBC_01443 TaxID=2903868 RepID=UPI002259454C|nr:ankyrin repeat domain-containing protein [Streptomyces sp. NBC_01443]MCX4626049.1 ankyrin repeat domain-containing protein [Streptomyces sp. NBC_01443]
MTAEVIGTLVAAGADPAARFAGAHAETPLHWAACNDAVEAVDALVAAGSEIGAPGAVVGGGTPLADACAFGQWRAARRLLELGARPDLQEAAALGLLHRVTEFLAAASCPPKSSPALSGRPATEVNSPPPNTSCLTGWTSTGSGTAA